MQMTLNAAEILDIVTAEIARRLQASILKPHSLEMGFYDAQDQPIQNLTMQVELEETPDPDMQTFKVSYTADPPFDPWALTILNRRRV